jgi:hypothetical protein
MNPEDEAIYSALAQLKDMVPIDARTKLDSLIRMISSRLYVVHEREKTLRNLHSVIGEIKDLVGDL